jgi:hypothetical protein
MPSNLPNPAELLAAMEIDFAITNGREFNMSDFTEFEVILGESLLTPGLQTSVSVNSYMHSLPIKNLDMFKNSVLRIKINRPILQKFNIATGMEIIQRVYRLENRSMMNPNVETFTLRACDETLLNDALTTVSKSWKCTRPSEIARYVLSSCAGAQSLDIAPPGIDSCGPARDYLAENIHPFQVVAQQLNVSLAEGDDPSFLHYMTYQKYGTHHYRSLKSLTKQRPIITYYYSETGASSGYADPRGIITHSFPCDFDLLSDALNGIDASGRDINSLIVFNPVNKMFSLVGNQTIGCGIGGGVTKMAQTNRGTAENQNSCNSEVEKYLLKRQARMSLLEKDKIALRITVPWNPELNVGKVIAVDLLNKLDKKISNYGSGTYLIMTMFHNIKRGGYAVTTMDCVSTTVGGGVV